ncbi:MAG: Flp pilus assembly complex ATPase component TadA [Deltaproteobacteria bacterium]|nr:Flp pilus assembly complex ATPase component TadA [Deltaproteobacteria bacterium]
MDVGAWIERAKEMGASDLHLEPGHPATYRIRGALRSSGDRLGGEAVAALARGLLGEAAWGAFLERGSADLSRTIHGVRCRVNVLRSARGAGLAIRLLHAPAATLKSLNLHPDLLQLVRPTHGLVLVAGPTGAGKSTTAAALVQEINLAESRHVITLESPIEYTFSPRRSLVRQREVGRDTPSFAQGLVDAMREDPDVLLVGEMREPEVMRLTLNAAETGHLVLATVHSATVAEALQRIVASFPSEIQPGVCAQLGDCLVGALAQRLAWRADPGLRVPECEVLLGSTAARSVVRQGHFFKLPTVIESGGAEGCWSFARYRAWLDQKQDWVRPAVDAAPDPEEEAGKVLLPPAPRPKPPEDGVLDLDGEAADLDAAIEALERRGR